MIRIFNTAPGGGGGGGSQTLQQTVNLGNIVNAGAATQTIQFTKGSALITIDASLQNIVVDDGASNTGTISSTSYIISNGSDSVVITSTYMTIQDGAGNVMTCTKHTLTFSNGSFTKTIDFSTNPATANRTIALQDASGTVAYLTDIPDTTVVSINAQSGTTYTFVLADKGKLVTGSNAGATIYTVPTNASVAFAIGTQIAVAQVGAGRISLAAAGGVTINSKGGNISTSAQYVQLLLTKTATNTWLLCGDLGP